MSKPTDTPKFMLSAILSEMAPDRRKIVSALIVWETHISRRTFFNWLNASTSSSAGWSLEQLAIIRNILRDHGGVHLDHIDDLVHPRARAEYAFSL